MKEEEIKEENGIKVIYRDRGIDYDRLEHMVSMLKNKKYEWDSRTRSNENKIKNDCKENFYAHFDLEKEKSAIDKIDLHIEKLRKSRERYEKKIEKVTKTKDRSYGQYDEIGEGSKVAIWIKECLTGTVKDKVIDQVVEECSERIYLARNIDEAVDAYQACMTEMERLLDTHKERVVVK